MAKAKNKKKTNSPAPDGETKQTGGEKTNKKTSVVQYPAKILAPIGVFLRARLKKLEKTKKDVAEEDPFANTDRVGDNASPDTDAAEQFGHARTSAIKEQLDRKIVQTKKAMSRIKVGKYGICEDCGNMIDTDRLVAFPEATMCASCKAKREK